jgi:hypothetical protein
VKEDGFLIRVVGEEKTPTTACYFPNTGKGGRFFIFTEHYG